MGASDSLTSSTAWIPDGPEVGCPDPPSSNPLCPPPFKVVPFYSYCTGITVVQVETPAWEKLSSLTSNLSLTKDKGSSSSPERFFNWLTGSNCLMLVWTVGWMIQFFKSRLTDGSWCNSCPVNRCVPCRNSTPAVNFPWHLLFIALCNWAIKCA